MDMSGRGVDLDRRLCVSVCACSSLPLKCTCWFLEKDMSIMVVWGSYLLVVARMSHLGSVDDSRLCLCGGCGRVVLSLQLRPKNPGLNPARGGAQRVGVASLL